MTNTITIEIRSVYGNDTIYPACAHSRFLCALMGTKTITREKLRLIRANGYDVVEAPTRLRDWDR